MKIATVAVYVENQDKALEFWTTKVGFVVHQTKEMGPNATWIEVGPENAESCLVIYPKSMTEDWNERKPSVVFECQNIQKQFEAMSQHGVEFTKPPEDMPWGKFAMFLDTEGNWFGLRQSVDKSAAALDQDKKLQSI
jgi:lactoylglutathione lyase